MSILKIDSVVVVDYHNTDCVEVQPCSLADALSGAFARMKDIMGRDVDEGIECEVYTCIESNSIVVGLFYNNDYSKVSRYHPHLAIRHLHDFNPR